MNRQNWKFRYKVTDIQAAVDLKIDKHTKKLKWWEDKKAETMTKVKETGIGVQDSVAASYSNTKGFMGARVVIDETLQAELTECHNKIMDHYDRLNEYKAWGEVLKGTTADTAPVLELDHSDYLFFFGE
jgi:hypothetical protein